MTNEIIKNEQLNNQLDSQNTTSQAAAQTKKCTGNGPETLCWTCQYCTGGKLDKSVKYIKKSTGETKTYDRCPWISFSKKVPGWNAEKTEINNRNRGGKLSSYLVKTCPLYKEDERKEPTVEDIIRDTGFTSRFIMRSRSFLWDYYDTYKILLAQAQKAARINLEIVKNETQNKTTSGTKIVKNDSSSLLKIVKNDSLLLTYNQLAKVQIAACNAYLEDAQIDLEEGVITQEEYDKELENMEKIEEEIQKTRKKNERRSHN